VSTNLISEAKKGTPFIDECAEESWEEAFSYYEDVAEVRNEPPKQYRIVFSQQRASVRLEEQAKSEAPELEEKFRRLADQWHKETRYISSVTQMAMHPAYQKIIGIGQQAVPFILREMQQRGGHWLWALHVITDIDPAPPNATFKEAVEAWLEWGKDYLT
jgi:hypothetical protein